MNCYKGKEDVLDRRNCRELKLTDQILKIIQRTIKKLIRQQVDIDEMQFGFMSGCKTLIDCMIFLSPLLDFIKMSLSTVSFLVQLDSGIFCQQNTFLLLFI